MKKQIILLILTLIAILVSVSAVSAADTYVNSSIVDDTGHTGLSWDQAFNTIQEGYNTVTDDNTIYLADGNYPRTDNSQIFIDKNINIAGQSQTGTILDAENENNFFSINSGRTVTIRNLTFEDGGDTSYGGAISNAGTLNIINCTFISNEADNDGGAIFNTGTLTVTDCTFINNSAGGDGGAIRNQDNGIATVLDSNFINNTASASGGAISNYHGSWMDGLYVSGCNFEGNQASGTESYQGGGAIYTNNWMNVNYSRFYGNTAPKGNAIFDYGANQFVYANNNWWGSNNPNFPNLVQGGTIDTQSWIVLNINANPTTMTTHGTSAITADLTHDNEGNDISGMVDLDEIIASFSSTAGTFNPINSPTINGIAVTTFTAGNTPGQSIIYVTVDDQPMQVTVNITSDGTPVPKEPSTVNAASSKTKTSTTVGMQETGMPIAGLILAILAVLGGLATSKRK